ncbi:dTDP-glucose 4,6-dehydratase [Planococcus sp. YIM B11945]|uniref:dTDP-glucose 4,6-dehydratase n=1 Tax=Planococcus sp. YIM B11945 TaxID=3435410 RepID=UPI003D7DBA6E
MSAKTILVTGGLGFIGSNFIHYILAKYPHYKIVNMDSKTYASDPDNLRALEMNPRYTFYQIDIRDAGAVRKVFHHEQITDVIHFAAESHVDNSIKNPGVFAETNVIGTLNLLEAARGLWQIGPYEPKEPFKKSRFHHISTDEVYGTLGDNGFFTEETPYAPNSPYSASKAGSDLLVRSFYHTYGLNVVTTNCSNNYGPMQHDEKLIPTIIRKALANEEIPIYGNGQNVRDWLYVGDHCVAIDKVFHTGNEGETYLIGGNNEKTNIEIAGHICEYLDEHLPKGESYKNQIRFVKDRHGHDFRYAIDATKLQEEFQFFPAETFESGLEKTIEWYIEKYKGADVLWKMG